MEFLYYPGCTLKTKAKDLDTYARLSAEKLGVSLEEIPEWQCCGGVYPLGRDEIATKLSSVRTLICARDAGKELVTMCSACHNVIKQVNNDMAKDVYIRDRVNNYLQPETPYEGDVTVLHFLEVLRDRVGFDVLKSKVEKPLTGRKIAAYYGCLLLRPSGVLAFDDPENPTVIEDFIAALGGTPVKYALRNECCGGYATLEQKDLAKKRGGAVLENAKENGAQEIITACPLCMYNLKKNAGPAGVQVRYFTELLAEALGLI